MWQARRRGPWCPFPHHTMHQVCVHVCMCVRVCVLDERQDAKGILVVPHLQQQSSSALLLTLLAFHCIYTPNVLLTFALWRRSPQVACTHWRPVSVRSVQAHCVAFLCRLCFTKSHLRPVFSSTLTRYSVCVCVGVGGWVCMCVCVCTHSTLRHSNRSSPSE